MFITFEGGDGAGKSTQAELLEHWLAERGNEVVRTREPGGTTLGIELRRILLHAGDGVGSIESRAEALLYAADRAQHVAAIVRPALERGAMVVQDRYIDSSIAYQGAGRLLPVGDIRMINEWASGGLRPDLTVLLDISPELSEERRRSRGGSDRFEAEEREFHTAVREGFLALAEADPDRFLVIDARLPLEDVHAQVLAGVSPLMSH